SRHGSRNLQPATCNRQRQRELFFFAQRTRLKTGLAQRLREVRGEPVQRENACRRDALHELDELRKIRVVTQWKRGVGPATKAAVGVNRPAGERRRAHAAEVAQRHRQVRHRRADQHAAGGGFAFPFFVGRKSLAEPLVNPGELEYRPVQPYWQSRVRQATQHYLAFAERIPEQYRRLVVIDGLATEANYALQHLARRRELILHPAVSRLHDEGVGVARFAWLCGQPATQ